jgi:hypothetical protein
MLKSRLTGGVEMFRQFLTGPVTLGVAGMSWWAEVSTDGTLLVSDGMQTLGFHVAAEDRWHHAISDPGVRRTRLEGTPVVETRMRVPNGDIVQTVYATAHRGGMVIVDYYNDSPLPVAIGIDRGDVVIESMAAVGSVAGADLGADAVTISLGHHSHTRVALTGHGVTADSSWFEGVPSPESVVAGWKSIVDRAGRFELPPGASGSSLAEAVIAARCAWLLGDLVDADDDPVSALLEWDQLCRMGERPELLIDDVALATESVARQQLPGLKMALDAAERVLRRADELRAADDVREIRERSAAVTAERNDSLATAVRQFEEQLVAPIGDSADILAAGISSDWSLQPIEVFHLPGSATATVSYAIRWHGLRPAIVWEVEDDALTLRCPVLDENWQSREAKGEALLAHTAEVSET